MGVQVVKVMLWRSIVGYLREQENGIISFQYDDDFLSGGMSVAPIKMPLSKKTYSDDLIAVAARIGMKKAEAEKYIKQVASAVSRWDEFAKEAGLSLNNADIIKTHLTQFGKMN